MNSSVSIIIPTYNCAELLPGAIRSVRNQDWSEAEIVVVDDGSDDHTSDILNQLADKDLCVIQGTHKGPGAARNLGISESRGEWIAFLDSDDWWLPGKLEAQFALIRQNSQIRVSYTGCYLLSHDGQISYVSWHFPQWTLLEKLLLGNCLVTGSMLIHRSCFDKVGGFDSDLRVAEDWDMWLRLACHFNCSGLSEPYIVVRQAAARNKYPVNLSESCNIKVIEGFFFKPDLTSRWPELTGMKDMVLARQYAILARSHLYSQNLIGFGRLALKAIATHPVKGIMNLCGIRGKNYSLITTSLSDNLSAELLKQNRK